MRASLCAVLLVAAGCTSERPDPAVLRVVPGEVLRGVSTVVRVEGENFLADLRDPFWSGQPAALDQRFVVRIDGAQLPEGAVTQLSADVLIVTLPPDLALGAHALTVTTPAGQQGTLQDALLVSDTIVPVASVEDAAAGSGEVVGAQELAGGTTLEVFAVLRSASGRYLGPAPSSWSLTAAVGTLTPSGDGASAQLLANVEGVAQVIAAPLDGTGAAQSGALTVRLPAQSLAFVTAAQTVAAGTCSAALTVEARSNGAPMTSVAAIPVTFTTATGVTLYADPACTTVASAVNIPAGSSRASMHARGTTAGTVTLDASASPGTASQPLTLTGGAAASFAWDAIPTQRSDVGFDVALTARDAFGNVAANYAGTAALSVVGTGTATCESGCSAGLSATGFTNGRWTGRVRLTVATGGSRSLRAADGAAVGTSAPFNVTTTRSPPLAKLFATSGGAASMGSTVTLDATGSVDYDSPTSTLQYSFDFSGTNNNPPPWTPWSSNPVATTTYSTSPVYVLPRVAVLDPDGQVGFAHAIIYVTRVQDPVCVVNEPNATLDDGATSCTNPGPDGRMSLAEAIRVQANGNQPKGISFAPNITVIGPASFTITYELWIVGDGKTALRNVDFATVTDATLVLSGVDYASTSPASLVVATNSTFALDNSHAHDFSGILSHGATYVLESRLERCVNACITLDTNSSYLNARTTYLVDSPHGISATGCVNNGVDVASTIFRGMTTSAFRINSGCNGAMLVNVTFDRNVLGVDGGGSGHTLLNTIFSTNTTAQSCTGNFTVNDRALLFDNTSDGCAANTALTLRTDPLFLDGLAGDYRLTSGSPAIDSGGALPNNQDVNGAGTGTFFGAAPDRGAVETY